MKTQGTDEVDAQNILNEIQEEKLSDNKLVNIDSYPVCIAGLSGFFNGIACFI